MGSPDFSIPSLNLLAENQNVVGVVTQPDRRAGRGRQMQPPPVKVVASDLGLTIIQPPRLRDREVLQQLKDWKPELIVVTAYGQILRQNVLELPPHGCLNVHASLLPRWRGAAPIQAAILHGDANTGVTIMRMDAGVDTGAIISQREQAITDEDTAETLSPRLAQLGANLLIETIPGYLTGDTKPFPQDDTQATYAPMLSKSDGELDFNQNADELARQVRAFNPWPGTFTRFQDKTLKIHRAHTGDNKSLKPGQPGVFNDLPAYGTSQGLLVLDEVQPAGKKPMSGEVFLQGARGWGKF